MKKINECRSCESKNIQKFFDLGFQPLANSLLNFPAEKENFYPLSLSWCPDCNLVQLNETINPKELFSEYVWVTGTSKTTRDYSKRFCDNSLSRINPKDSYILEVASNDGTFLIPFIEKGYDVLGIDPARNIADIALSNGINTKCAFFGEDTAQQIIKEKGKAKIVFARNVLPHVANTHDFVGGLKNCLSDDGLLILETHYAKKISEELHYDSIYHEHLCYFTIKSLENLLNQHEFYIEDIEPSPISGGSIVVYAKKENTESKPEVQLYKRIEEEMKLNQLETWKNFAEKSHSHKNNLLKILSDIKNNGESIVGYGASARSSTMLNFCGINTDHIPMIADQNPLKHNKYTAGTHIPIYNPDRVMDTNPNYVFITGWNFSEEIINILKSRYSFKGKCIIPLPNNPEIRDLK